MILLLLSVSGVHAFKSETPLVNLCGEREIPPSLSPPDNKHRQRNIHGGGGFMIKKKKNVSAWMGGWGRFGSSKLGGSSRRALCSESLVPSLKA